MADGTPIEWTDATWNPVTGCSVVSPGCSNCYAMRLAGSRLAAHPSRAGLTVPSRAGPVWTGQVRLNTQWLAEPLRWRRPRRIFVCAHGDLFHQAVPDGWIDQVFAAMALAPRHAFQLLTKRPERMRDYLAGLPDALGRLAVTLVPHPAFPDAPRPLSSLLDLSVFTRPLPNVWAGVSVETAGWAAERLPHLRDTPAALRWVSAEPLLGPVDLRPWLIGPGRLDWVVAGGESGRGARPMHPDWVRALRDQCADAGVPFLFKQWGAHAWAVATEGDPATLAPSQVGKSVAGRTLDGVLHDAFPPHPAPRVLQEAR